MEQVRPRPRTRPRAPEPPEAVRAPAHDGPNATGRPGDVQVIYGAGIQTMPLAGQRVGHAHTLLATMLQADRRAAVLVNGAPMGDDHVLQPGDRLELVHHTGEKGQAGRPCPC